MAWMRQGTDPESGLPLWFNSDTGEMKYGQMGSQLNPDAYDANGTMIATGWNPNMAFPTEQGGYSVKQLSSQYLANGGDPNDTAAFERYMRASYPLYQGSLDPNAIVPPSAMPESAGEGIGPLMLMAPAIGGIIGAAGGLDWSSLFNGESPSSGVIASGKAPTAVAGWSTEVPSVMDNGIWSGNYTPPVETTISEMAGGAPTMGQISPNAWAPGSLGGASSPSWLSQFGLNDAYKLLGPASNILSGAFGASAARNAANIQSGATRDAINAQTAATMAGIDELRRQNMQARADSMPWLQTGTQAIGTLGNLTGAGGDALNSPLLRKFTVQDFYNDPVTALSMQFGLDQGQRGIENMARARGSLNSGATLKDLTRFGTDYAGQQAGASRDRFVQDQTNAFNKLGTLSGIGQTAAQNITGSGNSAASSIAGMNQASGNTTASLLSGMGNARGAASIAGSNALGNALGSIGNWYTQNRLLDALGVK